MPKIKVQHICNSCVIMQALHAVHCMAVFMKPKEHLHFSLMSSSVIYHDFILAVVQTYYPDCDVPGTKYDTESK